jgi:23S rRNA (uracil1939-C5)-methyltransferase
MLTPNPIQSGATKPEPVKIESIDHEGRGVAHRADGKTLFIDGAITGELVTCSSYRKKEHYEMAQLLRVITPSAMRATPRCPHFGVCGGCSLQHIEASAQVAAKQRVLEDNLNHIGTVHAEYILPAIHGPSWGYRTRARLSVRLVEKKGGVLVGFHERKNSFIADMHSCAVLPPRISALIDPLRQLIVQLSIRAAVPQIEVVATDDVDALVLRHMAEPSEADQDLLRQFADQHHIQWWLQSKGPTTIIPFYPLDAAKLAYHLPEYHLVMPFKPSEFTQINTAVNPILIRRAMQLLAPAAHERIADMFCGIGNFTLPIARHAGSVIGIEGSQELVARATQNAARNNINNVQFSCANLFEMTPDSLCALGKLDKMLIDPPRDGALALVQALDDEAPHRIVYVSCNPASLARDAAVLVHEKGYRLKAAGIANMFPHTAHVESISVFERE